MAVGNFWEILQEFLLATALMKKIKHEKYFGNTDSLTYIATKDVGFDNQINYNINIRQIRKLNQYVVRYKKETLNKKCYPVCKQEEEKC